MPSDDALIAHEGHESELLMVSIIIVAGSWSIPIFSFKPFYPLNTYFNLRVLSSRQETPLTVG